MGKIKLTLSVEENIIIKAKEIAQSKNQSLSNIFERLLVDNLFQNQNKFLNSKANSLRGVAKSALSLKNEDKPPIPEPQITPILVLLIFSKSIPESMIASSESPNIECLINPINVYQKP